MKMKMKMMTWKRFMFLAKGGCSSINSLVPSSYLVNHSYRTVLPTSNVTSVSLAKHITLLTLLVHLLSHVGHTKLSGDLSHNTQAKCVGAHVTLWSGTLPLLCMLDHTAAQTHSVANI